MAEYQDVCTQTDLSYLNKKDREIRRWLLDAAIVQYKSEPFFSKKKVWLPDNVFPNPGMSETEMVEFMKSRGASHRCIKYARNKYSEVNSEGKSEEISESVVDSCGDFQPEVKTETMSGEQDSSWEDHQEGGTYTEMCETSGLTKKSADLGFHPLKAIKRSISHRLLRKKFEKLEI